MGLAILAILLWLLLFALPLILGIYLIWKQTSILQLLGWLLLVIVAFRYIQWNSPWYVSRGNESIQEFKFDNFPLGPQPTVRWLEASHQLMLVPDERVKFVPEPPEYNHILVVDLDTRKSFWQPKNEIDLDQTTLLEYLRTNPSIPKPKTEDSFLGFSLPFLTYQIPWFFSETHGWRWEKTYFGWQRLVVQESSSVIEINHLLFNEWDYSRSYTSAFVMEGKFLLVQPYIFTDRRIFVLGPFETSQNTQPQPIDKNKQE